MEEYEKKDKYEEKNEEEEEEGEEEEEEQWRREVADFPCCLPSRGRLGSGLVDIRSAPSPPDPDTHNGLR